MGLMLVGHYNHASTYKELLKDPIWGKALEWIQDKAPRLSDGEYAIEGQDMYANLHTADTLPRTKGVYEAHKQYIDLHYCLEGGEVIEWSPIKILTARTKYDAEKDYTLYNLPKKATKIYMTSQAFAIFLPGEGHMPKISDGRNPNVRKVVIKIHKDLVK
jgi:biofilm protein TabA